MGGGGEGLARKIWIEKLLEFFPKSADENMDHINALNLYHWYKYSDTVKIMFVTLDSFHDLKYRQKQKVCLQWRRIWKAQ